MTVWFTSDLHLGHRAVAYARRYGGWPENRSLVTPEDVVWHDTMLAERWDATVKYGDIVWVLGDLIANNKSLDAALDWMGQRAGTKHFVYGNHDPGHPMHTDSEKWDRVYREAFRSVGIARRRKIAMPDGSRQEVLLSHFPYSGDGLEREDRASQWRLRDEGLPVLHGHTHTTDKVTYDTDTLVTSLRGDVKQIHVGLDAHDFTPISLDTVVELLAEKSPAGE